MKTKLTNSQRLVLEMLTRPTTVDGDRLLHGRSRLASAWVLERLGYAKRSGLGYFNGERWRITDAGKAALAELGLVPCRHLNCEGPFDDCEIKTMPPPYEHIRFWLRGPRWTAGGNPSKVQFCRLRGCINGVLGCYGEMACHEAANGDDGREEGQ